MKKVRTSYIRERTGLTRQAINLRVRRNTIPAPIKTKLGRGGLQFCKTEVDSWIAAYNMIKTK